jgi:hypothetical protein
MVLLGAQQQALYAQQVPASHLQVSGECTACAVVVCWLCVRASAGSCSTHATPRRRAHIHTQRMCARVSAEAPARLTPHHAAPPRTQTRLWRASWR